MSAPTLAEAMEFARDLPADCHADRCMIVLRAEVERLKADLASANETISMLETERMGQDR